MSVGATLDLLRSIVVDHENRHAQSAPVVVHCVHESADTVEDAVVFGSVIRRAGGSYFRCHPEVPNPSFRGPLCQPMAAQASKLAAQRGIELSIDETDGSVVTNVQGATDTSDSAAILSQVVSLLCSSEIDSELSVFSYPTSELDEARASLIWELAAAVPLLRSGAPQTLVPIALGWVDVVRHCNPIADSVRYVVRGGELVRRQPRRLPDTRLNRILMDVDEPIVLFLGAGASASAHIPQGNALRDAAISYLTGAQVSSDELLPSFRQYLEDHPQRFLVGEQAMGREQFDANLTLERVLREEFHELSGRSRAEAHTVKALAKLCSGALQWDPPGRRALRDLVALLPRLVVAMVNFDQLVEDGLATEHEVIASVDDFDVSQALLAERMSGQPTVLPILKVHGTIDRPETLVADIDATTMGLPRTVEAALDTIISTAGRVTWVWVGCSMRDVDMRQWLRRQDASNITEFWVDPLPPRSVLEYAQERRLAQWASDEQTLADRQITESSDVFLPLLLERARELIRSSSSR